MIGRRTFLAGLAAGFAVPALAQETVLAPFQVAPLEGLVDIPAPSLDAFRDQITVLNFWASWCQGCQEEHRYLIDLQRKGVFIAGVAVFDKSEAALRYLEEEGNPYGLVGLDDKRELATMLGLRSIPQTFLIGRRCEVVWQTAEGLDASLTDELLGRIQTITG